MTGAQFEIRIDGTTRTYRDRKDYAMEAARLIKSRNPHSMVEVKDLRSGDVTAVALRPGWAMGSQVPFTPGVHRLVESLTFWSSKYLVAGIRLWGLDSHPGMSLMTSKSTLAALVAALSLFGSAAAQAEIICTNRGCYETGMRISAMVAHTVGCRTTITATWR
jgi:hypothetical protein